MILLLLLSLTSSFVPSGSLRAEMIQLVTANGGHHSKALDNTCTHLVSFQADSAKIKCGSFSPSFQSFQERTNARADSLRSFPPGSVDPRTPVSSQRRRAVIIQSAATESPPRILSAAESPGISRPVRGRRSRRSGTAGYGTASELVVSRPSLQPPRVTLLTFSARTLAGKRVRRPKQQGLHSGQESDEYVACPG